MHVALLTVGSRGDVQPFVALAQGLQRAGHRVTLAAPSENAAMAEAQGVPFVSLGVDFQALLDTPEARGALAGWPGDLLKVVRQGQAVTRQLLYAAGEVALAADAVVYHPKALVGNHVAEATSKPTFLAVPMPLVAPTRAFPIPFGVFPDLGPLNRWTYALTRLGMLPYHGMTNAWRREVLGLPPQRPLADPFAAAGRPLPVLYAFSEALVPRPSDWPEHVHVTGFWHLDDVADAYEPPPDLAGFLADGPPPVYVGFGSMAGRDPERTTATVLEAVRQAGVRVVLARGWGGLRAEAAEDVHVLDGVPHGWLFPRCAAVVHHGGAGTTHAGLRAGRPTLVCPFFGDQPFWGRRVHALGAGPAPIPQKRLTAEALVAALRQAVGAPRMRECAVSLGRRLRREDGVAEAVRVIERGTEDVSGQRRGH